MIGIGNNTDLTFKLGTSDVEIYLGQEKVYPDTPHDYSLDYFTIEALESGEIYMVDNIENNYEFTINENYDVWNTTYFPESTQITLPAGAKIHIRCSGTPKVSKNNTAGVSSQSDGIGTFVTTFKFKAYGNIMSLLYGADFKGQTTFPSIDLYDRASGQLLTQNYNQDYFLGLFYNNKNLVDAENLVLPATTLSANCYRSMFSVCTSLVKAPVLPATTLISNCYVRMFYRCKSLNYIKAMFTTTPSVSYTDSWVRSVASSGTFVKNKDATWNVTGNNGIPTGWTVVTE